MKFHAAYKSGQLLGQLYWHLAQACLGIALHKPLVGDVHVQLGCEVRGVVVPGQNPDSLQGAITRACSKLIVELSSDQQPEWLENANSEIHEGVSRFGDPDSVEINQAREIRNQVCSRLVNPAATFANDVRQIIEAACQKHEDTADRMSRSLWFGEFVSEALYPPEVVQFTYRPWASDEWGRSLAATDHGIVSNPDPVNHLAGFRRGENRDEHRVPDYLGTPIDPGELPIRASWFPELRTRWNELCIGALPDEIEQLITAFLEWDRLYFGASADEVRQLADALLNCDELRFSVFRDDLEQLIAKDPGERLAIRRPNCSEITRLIEAIDRGFQDGASRALPPVNACESVAHDQAPEEVDSPDEAVPEAAQPTSPSFVETADDATNSPKRSVDVKTPSDADLKIYWYSVFSGKTQTALASDPEFMRYTGQTLSQGRISRILSKVRRWRDAGNVLPDPVDTRTPTARSMDPADIDMGARQDRHANRQRAPRSDED